MTGFSKINGLGNSFIFFEEMHQDLSWLKAPEKVRMLCSTGHGLGADGLVFIVSPKDPKHHCRMEIFNSDGTEAEMCGNALRCVAHLFDHRHLGIAPILIETKSSVKEVSFVGVKNGEAFYKAQMGQPLFDLVASGELLSADKRKQLAWSDMALEPVYVNVGNPHAVIFLKAPLSKDEMQSIGAWLETHPNHPRRINIEFVEIISANEATVNVWERGCGMTQACGTGAVAVVAAGCKTGILNNKVTIHMPGGDLIIEADSHSSLYMTGPVQEVAVGQISAAMIYRLSQS